MKRTVSLVLSLIMILGIFASMPVTVNAATNGKCGTNLTWELSDDGVLTISGTGDMTNYSYNYDSPFRDSTEIKK